MSTCFATAAPPTPLEEFLFDLNGFIIVRQAVDPAALAAGNATLDRLQSLVPGQWSGHVHAHEYYAKTGLNLQQIYEAGEPWEALIDHPAYIGKVHAFVGSEGTFDAVHGPLFIDECLANLRGPGEGIGLHSGGTSASTRTRTLYRVQDGKFHCSQVNVLIAWQDIGPGDGATMVVPASHKSAFSHPQTRANKQRQQQAGEPESAEGLTGAIEVHLAAGDALIFTDHIMHGSAARRNPGQRRISVYRYGLSWGRPRHPYRASPALLNRLNPVRRGIVEPQPTILVPPPA